MDYRALAEELLRKMYFLNKSRPQRRINEGMRGEAFVLQYVIFHDGPVQPNEISRFMNISTARMAAALNGLERKGMLTRRIDPGDRRRILVELTEEGRRYADGQRLEMLDHLTRVIERLGEHDAVEFVRIMGRVADIFAEVHHEGDPHPPFAQGPHVRRRRGDAE